MRRFGFDGTFDGGLATQSERAAFDAAVNGAFDRDIAAADQIAGELRVRTENRVLDSAGWNAGADFVPVVMGRAVPTCVDLMAGLVLSEHELDTPSANGSHE
jgi:hypothetical protein